MAICTPNGTLLEVLGKGAEEQNPKDNLEGEDGDCNECGGPPPHRGGHGGRGGIGGTHGCSGM